jgi:hypothetical protein
MRSFKGGGSILVKARIAHGFRTNLVVIKGNMNDQRFRDEILALRAIQLFQITPMSLFQT